MNGCVLVLGSVNVDLIACMTRLPVAGETVTGTALTRQLGGKGANQAVAVARAGSVSVMIGAVGDDEAGTAMRLQLDQYGVDVSALASAADATGHALVLTSPHDNQIVVVPGANQRADYSSVIARAPRAGDVCLTQMETPGPAALSFFKRARALGATTMLNAAPAGPEVLPLLPWADILVVNESELSLISGVALDADVVDARLVSAASSPPLDDVGVIVATLGPRGVALIRRGRVTRWAGRAVEVVDTTGAGDCFCGYLAAGLARGDSLESAVAEANVAASLTVLSLGAAASMPSRSQVLSVEPPETF